MLRIIPRTWDAKRTIVEEAQNLNTLTLCQLREKLQVYESHLITTTKAKEKSVPKAEGSKKVIAFRVMNDELDEDGTIKDDYVWDGLHFNVAGAHAMEDYISTHVVRRESYVKEICQLNYLK